MYKILIVDDEYYFRKGFRVVLPFEDYGFTICDEARNGVEALEKLEKHTPDVIFIDINMPIMNGLDFAAEVKARGSRAILVLLTGYSEFSYAQKAVHLGISRYMLKPVSEKELGEALRSLKDNIEIARKLHIELENLREQAEKSEPVLRDRFLSTLLRGGYLGSETEIVQKLKQFNLCLKGEHFCVALMEIDAQNDMREEDISLWRYAVMNVAQEIIARSGINCICREEDEMVCVIFSINQQSDENKGKICGLLEEVHTSIKRNLGFSITTGIGTMKTTLAELSISNEEAIVALKNKLSLGDNMIISYEMIENPIIVSYYTMKRRAELLLNLRIGNIQLVERIVDDVFDALKQKNASLNTLMVTCIEIMSTCFEYLAEADQCFPGIFSQKKDIMSELLQMPSLEEMQNWLMELLRSSVQIVRQNHNNRTWTIANNVKHYIESNYNNAGLTISDIAGSLCMNYGYLCCVFKQETGRTINEYISEFRITKAKGMLDDGYTYILDIAEKCGFTDQGYFSKCFKKTYGVAPSKYIINAKNE